MGLAIYLLFTVSWFLHLPTRFPALGAVRFDLVLIVILLGLCLLPGKSRLDPIQTEGEPIKWIWILVGYILLTIPLVYWPGSAVRQGIPLFLKAFVFFIFTLRFVRNPAHLKIFFGVYLGCQLFRILEPAYLHVTEGYWGSHASMRGWESMDRLAGAPLDVINPNGLAFICLTVLPFLYYYAAASWKSRVVLVPIMLLVLYALALTGSRSGIIGFLVILLAILIKTRKRILLPVALLSLLTVGYNQLSGDFKDRYASIVDEGARNATTFEGRVQGIKDDFMVVLHRPVFGHGLGTSPEANYNFRGGTRRSHNLYTEIGQELGFVGLVIFILYILSLLRTVRSLKGIPLPGGEFLAQTNKGLEVWFYMNLVFSMATFGLSGHQWYLFGALILRVRELSLNQSREVAEKAMAPPAHRGILNENLHLHPNL